MAKSTAETLPTGLYRRGKTYWISKTIKGQRYQFSTECSGLESAKAVFAQFLEQHDLELPAAVEEDASKPKLPRGLYWKGNVIWISRTVDGKHYNVTTGTSDLKLAQQVLNDFNLKAFKGETFGLSPKKRLTFQALSARYISQGEVNGLRPRSLARYRAIANNFQLFLERCGQADTDVESFTPSLIEDFKAWRATTPLNRNGSPVKDPLQASSNGAAPRTIQMEVQSLSSFFRYGISLELIGHNPVARTRPMKVGHHTPVYLEPDEVVRFLAAAKSYDAWSESREPYGAFIHDVLLTYLKTGMRLNELRYLETSDIDLSDGLIHVRNSKTVHIAEYFPIPVRSLQKLQQHSHQTFEALPASAKKELFGAMLPAGISFDGVTWSDVDLKNRRLLIHSTETWNPKSKGRIIPISPGLAPILASHCGRNTLLFPDPRHDGLWRFKINRIVKQCAKHADLSKDIHTHTLRHTFATLLRRSGVPLETIKELLGHADIRETLIYAHFSKDEARAAIPKIDLF